MMITGDSVPDIVLSLESPVGMGRTRFCLLLVGVTAMLGSDIPSADTLARRLRMGQAAREGSAGQSKGQRDARTSAT